MGRGLVCLAAFARAAPLVVALARASSVGRPGRDAAPVGRGGARADHPTGRGLAQADHPTPAPSLELSARADHPTPAPSLAPSAPSALPAAAPTPAPAQCGSGSVPSDGRCPAGDPSVFGDSTTFNRKGSCYVFARTPLTWRAARAACRTLRGGHLATIDSVSEDAFLRVIFEEIEGRGRFFMGLKESARRAERSTRVEATRRRRDTRPRTIRAAPRGVAATRPRTIRAAPRGAAATPLSQARQPQLVLGRPVRVLGVSELEEGELRLQRSFEARGQETQGSERERGVVGAEILCGRGRRGGRELDPAELP